MIKSGRDFIRMSLDSAIGTPCERELLDHEIRNVHILVPYEMGYISGAFDKGYDDFINRQLRRA